MQRKAKDQRARAYPAAWFVVSMALFLAASASAGLPNEMCADCHDEVTEAFETTPHGTYFAHGEEHGCESCHGNGMAHVESGGDPEQIINPANTDQFSAQALCLNCHQGHQFDDWAFSAHNSSDVSCSDCHTIHGSFEQSVKKPSPQLCYDCHSDIRAKTFMPSHHPIREGGIGCEDCHGVHGGSGRLTLNSSSRELCLGCHAEKEGPFMYEHAPVNEDCNLCHTPHGSVADNLLTVQEPTLCLNCHPMHFHAGVEASDGEWPAVNADLGRSGTSHPDSWKEGMLTKCTQCHSEVHGSDLPSQAISTSGKSLTR